MSWQPNLASQTNRLNSAAMRVGYVQGELRMAVTSCTPSDTPSHGASTRYLLIPENTPNIPSVLSMHDALTLRLSGLAPMLLTYHYSGLVTHHQLHLA